MKEEILALKRNETWAIVPLPSGISSIYYKQIYKIKRKKVLLDATKPGL